MENITRDIIVDLYPLYLSGDASPDTRRIVETFLREDPEFASSHAETGTETGRRLLPREIPVSLRADHELKTLARVRRRLSGPMWLLQLALISSCLAFGRIVSDTSFDVSPRNFIVTAVIAVCFSVAFLVKLFPGRRTVLVHLRSMGFLQSAFVWRTGTIARVASRRPRPQPSSSSNSPNRSNRFSQIARRSSIHSSTTDSPEVSIRHVRTLPSFSVRTRPLFSSTCRCCTTAASVIARGFARSDTEIGPSLSLSTSARRVGSPRAWNTRSTFIFR